MGNFNNELKNWQQIPKLLINDNTLSDRARFVYCFMACKSDDWNFFMQPLAKDLGYSVDTLRKYINELIGSGWLSKGEQTRNPDNTWSATKYTLHAQKVQPFPDTEKIRHGEIPAQYNTDIDNKSDKEEKEDTNVSKKEQQQIDYDFIKTEWERVNPDLASIRGFNDKRRNAIKNLLKKNNASVDDLIKAFEVISICSFCKGSNDRSWKATFDWVIADTKSCFNRLLEGDFVKGRYEREQFDAIMSGNNLSLQSENSDTLKFQF